MRKISLLSLAVLFCVSLISFSVFAETKNSLEYNVESSQWLNQGKVLNFNGKKDQKNLVGKFYVRDSGVLTFNFYNSSGKLVLTHTKVVRSNPEKRPFFSYNFSLDEDFQKGYLEAGKYKVQVIVSSDTSTWGWLNY